jgi:hypothetical protein
MRTAAGVILGMFLGGVVCGFGPCIGIDLMFRQGGQAQGDLEVFALCMLTLFGGGVVGAVLGGIVGGVIGARKDLQAELAPGGERTSRTGRFDDFEVES